MEKDQSGQIQNHDAKIPQLNLVYKIQEAR